MPLDANQKRLRASMASLTAWEKATPEQRSARGRNGYNGLIARFEAEALAEGAITRAQVNAAVKTKLRLHFQRMTYKSLQSRKAKREAQNARAAEMRAKRDKASAGAA